MDGIKKNILPETPKSFPQKLASSKPKKAANDVVFISPQDSLRIEEKYEKKFKQGEKFKKTALPLIALLLIATFSYLGYFSWKTITSVKKMQSGQVSTQSTLAQNMRAIISPVIPMTAKPLKGEKEGRINILLMGAAGQNNPGRNLTDTIMMMSIDTKNKKVALLSLPRDLYVNVPDTKISTKINSLYQIGLKQDLGISPIKDTVEKITGLTINYYLVIDFDGFKKIIDDIGGINVISERDLYDTRYPGPNYSYETFSLSKGFHTLDGATALKYVRERHSDPEGDFGRAKRQQQVIQSVKGKLFSLETFFNVAALNNVLTTLGDNIKTDIALEDIAGLINLSKNVDTQNINNVVVDAWKPESLLKVSHVNIGNVAAFILVPRVGNYSEIQDVAKNIFDQTILQRRRDSIATENASIAIINQSGDNGLANKVSQLLTEKLHLKNVRISQGPANIAQQTTVRDNSNGLKIFTTDELIKKLPATLASSTNIQTGGELAENNAKIDLVVTLGEDLLKAYNFETDSIEDYNKAQDSQDNLDFTNNN